jgi:hypothetical protein
MNIETRITPRRRCGVRKPGGLYLVAPGTADFCGKLPVELTVCPCCSRGIKPSRGWTWVDATKLLTGEPCRMKKCIGCPVAYGLGRAGLIWIGTCYYPSHHDWTREAIVQGVCRRIPAVPNDFQLGYTWVLVAHRQAITKFADGKGLQSAGIFHVFRPTAVEYVVNGKETPEVLEKLVARGITPVRDQLPETAALPMQ